MTSPRLGKMWSALIVAQVACAMAILPGTAFTAWSAIQNSAAHLDFPADEFLSVRVVLGDPSGSAATEDPNPRAAASRYGARVFELLRRLSADTAVADITYSARPVGHEATVWVEVEDQAHPDSRESDSVHARLSHEARQGLVAENFFTTFSIPLLTGRALVAADTDATATAVVVNREFVEKVLDGDATMGRRIRYVGRVGDSRVQDAHLELWLEIVGVVSDFPGQRIEPGTIQAKVYHVITPERSQAVTLAIRTQGMKPGDFGSRLRELAANVDPLLHLRQMRPLDEQMLQGQDAMQITAFALGLVTLSVLLLSAGGIYALMSFAVSQRRREIGIRVALGANRAQLLRDLFSRALGQLGLGLIVGSGLSVAVDRLAGGDFLAGNGALLLSIASRLMLVVMGVATRTPARRALAIQATEALREQ